MGLNCLGVCAKILSLFYFFLKSYHISLETTCIASLTLKLFLQRSTLKEIKDLTFHLNYNFFKPTSVSQFLLFIDRMNSINFESKDTKDKREQVKCL